MDLNELFVCSQCGKSIAEQMDNLDYYINKTKFIVSKLEELKQELQNKLRDKE